MLIIPSLVSSREAEKIPDIPDLFNEEVFLKFKGIKLDKSLQSFKCFIFDLIISIPCSVEHTGNFGMLIDKKFFCIM